MQNKIIFDHLYREFRMTSQQLDLVERSPILRRMNERHREFLADARLRGESDGRRNVPGYDDRECSYEVKVKKDYQSLLESLLGKPKQLLAEITAYEDHLRAQHRNAPAIRLKEQIASIEDRFRRLCIEYDRPGGETDAADLMLRSKKLAVGILVLLTVPELVILQSTIQILAFDPFLSWTSAIFIVVFNAIFGHQIGTWIKRRNTEQKNAAILFFSSVLGLFSFVLVYLRSWYFKVNQSAAAQKISKAEALAQIDSLGVLVSWEFLASLFLLSIPILLWGYFGYILHDSSKGFEKGYKDVHLRLPKLKDQLFQHQELAARQQETWNKPGRTFEIIEQLEALQNMRSSLANSIDYYGQLIKTYCAATIYAYRDENELNRTNTADTPYLWNFPLEEATEWEASFRDLYASKTFADQ